VNPLRSFSLRFLIRLSDFIEIWIVLLRPEPKPYFTKENLLRGLPDDLNYIEYLNDCFALSED
jgi:hypothetical protein